MGGYAAKMLRAFEGWAKNRGAIELAFGVNSGLETGGVGRLVRRMGFCSVGENFSKSL